MSKIRNFVEITPNLPFSEFNFYELYRETFEHSELGRMKKILPLHEMAESFGLVSKSMVPKRGRKSYFTPEGKVAPFHEGIGYHSMEYPKCVFWKMDISNKGQIDELFARYKFDIVVNLAAQAGVRYSIENPDVYIQSNIIGFYNILEACRYNPVQHLVYASSSSV